MFTKNIHLIANFILKYIALIAIAIGSNNPMIAQEKILNPDLHFAINRVMPSISISRVALDECETLLDLNKYYKPNWVKEYLAVAVTAIIKGKVQTAINKSDVLSLEQKQIIKSADLGTDIKVDIKYMPENDLPQNDIAHQTFSFTIEPENEAHYIGGLDKLHAYIKAKAIDQIPSSSFTGYALCGVKFIIDKHGEITNTHIWESSKNEEIDQLLLQAVCNMPNWQAATYANGQSVSQEFVLTVGNMDTCQVQLLNIKRY